jgi:hypothetical protein
MLFMICFGNGSLAIYFLKLRAIAKWRLIPTLKTTVGTLADFLPKTIVYRNVPSLKNPLIAGKGKRSSVFYHTLLEEIFVQPQNLDIAAISANPSKMFKTVSANYADMFVIDRVQN